MKLNASQSDLAPPVLTIAREFPANSVTSNVEKSPSLRRIFLLSPASMAGIRGRLVMNEDSDSEMARRMRLEGVPLGELFGFMSGLYFRGKLTYASAFANPPENLGGMFVITASGGLVPPETRMTQEKLREICACNIDSAEPRYRMPLDRDAHLLAKAAGRYCEIVLLGSIATPKYIDPLLPIFAERLVFPSEFVGRGDMSRGGLMLRCVQSGEQLTYVSVQDAVRHGRKPPKLLPLARAIRSSRLVGFEG